MTNRAEVDLDFNGVLVMDDKFGSITITHQDFFTRIQEDDVERLVVALKRWLESGEKDG